MTDWTTLYESEEVPTEVLEQDRHRDLQVGQEWLKHEGEWYRLYEFHEPYFGYLWMVGWDCGFQLPDQDGEIRWIRLRIRCVDESNDVWEYQAETIEHNIEPWKEEQNGR